MFKRALVAEYARKAAKEKPLQLGGLSPSMKIGATVAEDALRVALPPLRHQRFFEELLR